MQSATEKQCDSPRSMAIQAKAYLDLIDVHLLHPTSLRRETVSSSVRRWSPPPDGWVSVNVDAAIFQSAGNMGVGVLIRDHIGACLMACSELIKMELAEAMAMRRALSLAIGGRLQQYYHSV